MADIVLKDGSDVSTTYRETKALGVDTPDGGIALFFSEEVIPKEYTHPDTHHASMITGLAKVARSGRYNDLFGIVVGDLPSFEENTVKFSPIYEGATCYQYEAPGVWGHVLGSSYTVTWNGEVYEGVFKDVSEAGDEFKGGYYLGNITKFWNLGRGEDTGEPFVLCVSADELYNLVVMTSDPTEHHTLSIKPNSVKKLDKKYLPDEAATKDFVADEIAKIQASGGTSEIDILPETELTLQPAGFDGVYFIDDKDNSIGIYDYLSLVELNKEYYVVLDGVEYRCTEHMSDVEIPEDVTVNSARVLGNLAIAGPDYEDSGEPFVIQYSDMIMFETVLKSCQIAVKSDIPDAESITVKLRIYQKTASVGSSLPEFTFDDENKVLTIKDGVPVWADVALDSSASNVIEILPEKEYTLEADDVGYGFLIAFYEEDAEENIEYKSIRDLTLGEKYIVSFEGVSYECECQDRSKELEGGTGIVLNSSRVLGNLYYYDMSAPESSGEPFCIMFMDGEIPSTGDSNYPVNQVSFSCVSDIAAETINVKIGISKKGNSGVESSLPEITKEDEGKVLTVKDGSPAWATISGASTVTEVEILPETELTLAPDGDIADNTQYYFIDDTNTSGLYDYLCKIKNGEEYCVVIDGKEYECIECASDCRLTPPEGVSIAYVSILGNPHLAMSELPDSGYPFVIQSIEMSHPEGSTKMLVVCVNSNIVGAETITCKLRIYQKAKSSPQYSWNDIADKPFGDEIQSIELMNDTISFDYMSKITEALYGYGSGYIFNNDVSKAIDAGFNTATVEWNGTEYVVETIIEDGAIILGNFEILDGIGDNGLPFAMAIGKADGEYGAEIYAIESIPPENIDNPEPITKTVKVSIEINNIKTLDLRYLPEHLQLGKESTKLVDILPLQTYEDFQVDPDYRVCCTQVTDSYPLTVGETYIVSWDGADYECVAQDGSAFVPGAIVLGDASSFRLSGNNEPFLISTIKGMGTGFYSLTDTGAGNSHTVGIKQEVTVTKTLDLKYLPEHLQLGKESTNVVEILPLQTYENFLYSSTYKAYCTSTGNPPTLTLGETYIVSWDEEEYKCVAQDASAMMPGAIFLGNSTALGVPSDEPFAIGVMPGMGVTFVSVTDTEEGNSHVVGIIQEVVVTKTLDPQYLPEALRFGEAPITATLIDGRYDTRAMDESGDVLMPKDLIPVISDIHLTEGNTYTVVWDGVVYECECSNYAGLPYVGNGGIPGVTEDTGEPFMIMEDTSGESTGVDVPGFVFFASNTSDPSITERTFEVKLTYSGPIIQKLDGKYLPELFDYLPEPLKIGKISAGTVLVKETTAICNTTFYEVFISVSSKPFGFIPGAKYQFVVDGVPYITECYEKDGSVFLGRIELDPFVFVENFQGSSMSVMISKESGEYTYEITYAEDYIKKIDKEYLPDDIGVGGSSLPKVTTSDNNKVMTVVNGAWAAQTPASELPTVTGSDNNKVLKVINGSWGIGNETNELPTVTSSDAGKFLRVSSTGTWIVEALQDVSEVGA